MRYTNTSYVLHFIKWHENTARHIRYRKLIREKFGIKLHVKHCRNWYRGFLVPVFRRRLLARLPLALGPLLADDFNGKYKGYSKYVDK